jgi:Ca2+-binding EF-hand superfamily protein
MKFKEITHPDAALSLQKFASLTKLTYKLAEPIFSFIDMDGDEWLDDYEFICALAMFSKTSIDERLEAVYTIYDNSPKNSVLEKKELVP